MPMASEAMTAPPRDPSDYNDDKDDGAELRRHRRLGPQHIASEHTATAARALPKPKVIINTRGTL